MHAEWSLADKNTVGEKRVLETRCILIKGIAPQLLPVFGCHWLLEYFITAIDSLPRGPSSSSLHPSLSPPGDVRLIDESNDGLLLRERRRDGSVCLRLSRSVVVIQLRTLFSPSGVELLLSSPARPSVVSKKRHFVFSLDRCFAAARLSLSLSLSFSLFDFSSRRPNPFLSLSLSLPLSLSR